MSRTGACVALVLCLPSALEGQGPAALESRILDLRGRLARVEARLRERDSLADAARGWRRLAAGPITLEIADGDPTEAERALADAAARLAPRYGTLFEQGEPIPLRASPRPRQVTAGGADLPPLGISLQYTGLHQWGQPSIAPYVPAGSPHEALTQALVLAASHALWYRVDRPLARWHPAPPLAAPESLLARRTFVELATSDFESAAHCLSGALIACRAALGLVPDPTDPVGSYPPGDRRAFVRRLAQGDGERSGLAGQCLQLGRQAACDAVLRGREWGALVPLGESGRQQLLALALTRGGAGAMGRLLTPPGRPLEERLADAARTSADTLLQEWLLATRAARTAERDDTPGSALAAIGWSLLLFALAVGNFRWR